jgi:hypothetical protein
MQKCAIVITGHIRSGFRTQCWNNFISELSKVYDVDLYIQTWEESEAISSWRRHQLCERFNIDEKLITDYFKHPIKELRIDNEYRTKINGRFKGPVCLSSMPVRGWKKMICGMHLGVKMAQESGMKYDFIIRSRFDYFTKFSENHIVDHFGPKKVTNEYLISQIKQQDKTNICWLPECIEAQHKWCIDNFYFGSLEKISRLLGFMSSKDIDALLKKKKLAFQEHYFYEAEKYVNEIEQSKLCVKN